MSEEPKRRDLTSYYTDAFHALRRDPVPWVLVSTVWLVVTLLTCGMASLLFPAFTREVGAALNEQRGPRIGAAFDTSNASQDLVNGGIWLGAMSIGSTLGGVGGVIASAVLQLLPSLAADDRYAPMDNAKLAVKHAMKHPTEHLVFLVVSWAGGFVAISTFFFLFPIVIPLISIAHWRWYETVRDEIDEMAEQAGIPRRPVLEG
jgi:hypothetical protein